MNGTSSDSAPLNVYRVAAPEHTTGWIILTAILGLLIVGLLIGWIICVNADATRPPCQCFGSLGVEIGVDANALNVCQPGNNSPCVFTVTSLAAANTQCLNLGQICQAFTYDPTLALSQMKIVDPNTSFTSTTANLYVRQVAPIS
jgi:hypothetical protein